MDERAAKLALARKKLKDHQDKKNQEHKFEPNGNNEHKNGISIPEQSVTEKTSDEENKDLNTVKAYSTAEHKHNENIPPHKSEVDTTEFLISSKRNLELQVIDLQNKNTDLESNLLATSHKNEIFIQKVTALENELKNLSVHYNAALEQLQSKNVFLKELNDWKAKTSEEKTDLQEQLEFTKAILAAKETENDSLHSQLFNVQSQLDTTQLQLQQLTSGIHNAPDGRAQENLRHDNEMLLNKVTSLEQQLKSQLKDYQQINSHYEHYVGELNEQLKTITRKNEDLNRELQHLSNRENSLIEQISDMEIRIQNYNRTVFDNTANTTNNSNTKDFEELKEKYEKSLENLQLLSTKYEGLQKLYVESNTKIEELSKSKEFECKQNDEVSLQKLNADITSDKVAAQRAAEQNKKLKQDLQGLEETVIKMTKDKLELTEKNTAEKFLNRELTIKLAEIDEKANNLQTTLKAKDEEMMRLQVTYREVEKAYEELKLTIKSSTSSESFNNNFIENELECKIEENHDKIHYHSDACENKPLIEASKDSPSIAKGDAMLKLQERFLKIMGEVADLSDEKHRLEHIIMQLQNETDTICEYVALYQQQRSLLKKRDEERSAQIKKFQTDCNRLHTQLNELTDILKRFAEDKELSSYFHIQKNHEDIQKVMSLLLNLKTNSILDPHKNIEFNNFYPCSCCSGQLIEV